MEPILRPVPASRAGYGWPVVGIFLWTLNLVLWPGGPALSAWGLVGQCALIGGGLAAMFRQPLPATEAGRLLRVTQTVGLLASVLSSLQVLEAIIKLLPK